MMQLRLTLAVLIGIPSTGVRWTERSIFAGPTMAALVCSRSPMASAR